LDEEKEKEPELEPAEYWSPGDVPYFGPIDRAIALYGEISRESALVTISQLLELDRRENAPIELHLNTDGGALADALAIYDQIRFLDSPVVVIATGTCASAGLIILSAGDLRMATEHCLFFYHQAILPPEEIACFEQIDSTHMAYQLCQNTYDNIIMKRSKMSKTMFKKEFKGKISKYFTAEEAQKYKLIDGIMLPQKKKIKIKLG